MVRQAINMHYKLQMVFLPFWKMPIAIKVLFICYHNEMVKSDTRGMTAETFLSSGDLLRSFVESFLGPTSRAGTLDSWK
jgi:hypothetical protein